MGAASNAAIYSLQPSASSLAAARVQQKLATVMSVSHSMPCLPKPTAYTSMRVWHRPFDDVMPATAKLVPSAGSSIKLTPSSSHATLTMHASSWASCRVPHATSPGAIGDSRQRPTAHWSLRRSSTAMARAGSGCRSAAKLATPSCGTTGSD
jgi:hypothetical protein